MKFTVIWNRPAETKLAELWLNAAEQNLVAQAANEMDRMLREEPYAVGESREGLMRILTVSPLSIYYDINKEDMMVTIWAVWNSTVTAK